MVWLVGMADTDSSQPKTNQTTANETQEEPAGADATRKLPKMESNMSCVYVCVCVCACAHVCVFLSKHHYSI